MFSKKINSFRKLRIESLESREMLSVSPLGIDDSISTYTAAALNNTSEQPFVIVTEHDNRPGNYTLFTNNTLNSDDPKITASSPINSKSYDITIRIGTTTTYVYLTGLTLAEKNAIVSVNSTDFINNIHPYDAEKLSTSKGTNSDIDLCWAGTTANILAYTGWGNVNGFQNEDDIFDCFRGNFTDDGGNVYYGTDWFITGNYYPQGSNYAANGWAQVKNYGNSGGYWLDYVKNINNISAYNTIDSKSAIDSMLTHLQDGDGVGLSVGWHQNSDRFGGHAITVWGVVYDTSKTGSDYYVGLLVSDSDNNKPYGYSAPDKLALLNMQWDTNTAHNGNDGKPGSAHYCFTNYSNGVIEEFTYVINTAKYGLKLSTPTLSTGTITSNSVALSWNTISNAGSYTLQYKKTSDDGWTTWSSNINGTNTTVTGLSANTPYQFRLKANGTVSCADSDWSNTVSATTTPAPNLTAPTWIELNGGVNSASGSWNSVGNASSYTVQWSTSSSFDTITGSWTGTETTFSQSGIPAGNYYFRVKAVGNGITYSDSAWTNYGSPTAVEVTATKLTAPTWNDLTGGVGSASGSWTAVDNRSRYTVEWSTSSSFSTIAGSWIGTATSFEKSDIAGGTYYFRVRAVGNGTTYSDSEWEVYGLPVVVNAPKLATPTNFTVTGGDNTASGSWTAVNNRSSYTVEWSTNSNFSTIAGSWTGTAPSFSKSGIAEGTYYFRVRAIGDGIKYIDSDWKDYGSAVNVTTKLTAPTWNNLTGGMNTASGSWDPVPYASSYTVQWSTNSNFSTIAGSWTGTATSFSKSEIPAGNYYFRVKSVGNGIKYSDSNWKVYGLPTAITVTAKLTAPTWNTLTGGFNSANGSWNTVSYASSYIVEWSTSSAFAEIADSWTGTTPSFSKSGIPEGTYYFRVKAVGNGTTYIDSGWKVYDSAVNVKTKLTAPTWNTLTSGANTASGSWEPVPYASSYTVEWSTSSAFAEIAGSWTGTATSFSKSDISAEAYYFRVRAIGNGTTYESSDWNVYDTAVNVKSVDTAWLDDFLDAHSDLTGSIATWKNGKITSLALSGAGLTGTLDVSVLTELTYLNCYDNQLTALNMSNCTALTYLYCYDNQLTALNVSNCTALKYLSCRSNQLTSLDVSGCTALTFLYCSYNQLTALDVSENTALTYLYCYDNQLTALNVSKNTALTELYCSYNGMKYLYLPKNSFSSSNYNDGNPNIKMIVGSPLLLDTPTWNTLTGGVNSVSGSWTAVNNRLSYTVEWSTSSDFSTTTGRLTGITGTFFSKSDIPEGTYYFRVRAVGNGTNYSNSDWNVYDTAVHVTTPDQAWLDNFLAAHTNLTDSIATWTNGQITSLNLNNKGLTGTLDVSALTALTYLDCDNNGIVRLYLPKAASGFSSISYGDGNPDIEVIVSSAPPVVTVGKKDGTAPTSSVTAAFAVEDFNRIEEKNSKGKIITTATSYIIKAYAWDAKKGDFSTKAAKTFTVKSTAANTVDGVLTYTPAGLKANTLYQITIQVKADAKTIYVDGIKTEGNTAGEERTLGEVRTLAVVPNASLKASTLTENSVNVKVSNWGTSGGLWTQAVAAGTKSAKVYTPIETDKATATVSKNISAVDTMLVTYSWSEVVNKKTIKHPETVTLTWDGESWSGSDGVSFDTAKGMITINGLSPSVKYTVQVQFSRSGEAVAVKATSVKATSVSVSTTARKFSAPVISNFQLTADKTAQVSFNLSQDVNGRAATQYKVEFLTITNGKTKVAKTLTVDIIKTNTNNAWSFDGDSVTAYITDLKAGTDYQVRVKALAAKKTAAYNYANIASDMSEAIVAACPPPAPPQNPFFSFISPLADFNDERYNESVCKKCSEHQCPVISILIPISVSKNFLAKRRTAIY